MNNVCFLELSRQRNRAGKTWIEFIRCPWFQSCLENDVDTNKTVVLSSASNKYDQNELPNILSIWDSERF